MLKVDHAGEHGAVCIYRAQRRMARWWAVDGLADDGDGLSECLDDPDAHFERLRKLVKFKAIGIEFNRAEFDELVQLSPAMPSDKEWCDLST